jgi:hypothetical protein
MEGEREERREGGRKRGREGGSQQKQSEQTSAVGFLILKFKRTMKCPHAVRACGSSVSPGAVCWRPGLQCGGAEAAAP